MTRASIRLVLCGALVGTTAAVCAGADHNDDRNQEIRSHRGRGQQHSSFKLPEGTKEMTVPEDFRFDVDGKVAVGARPEAWHRRHRDPSP